LASDRVATLIETLSSMALPAAVDGIAARDEAAALRFARSCYDHLAGRLGVLLFDALLRKERVRVSVRPASADIDLELTAEGEAWLRDVGIDADKLRGSSRPIARLCLDWSERRYHLAGALGAALLTRLFDLDWISRSARSRAVIVRRSAVQRIRDAWDVELGP
jgi:hypothetical protein